MSFPKGQVSYYPNGTSQDLFNVPDNNGGFGVFDSPMCFYQWIPQTASDDLIASAQTCPTTDGYLTLNYNTYSTGNSFHTTENPTANSFQLDCPRIIEITLDSEPSSAVTFLITGYDKRYVEYQTEVTIGTSATSASTNVGFYGIISIEVSSGSEDADIVVVGTNSYITLPYFSCLNQNFVIQMTYNGSQISPYTYLTAASNWRTTQPGLTTSDCKGVIQLPSAPNASKLFTILYWVYGEDAELQAALQAGDTSAYQLIGEPNPPSTTSPYPADTPPPLLVQADSTGLQAGIADLAIYDQLLNIGRIVV